MTTSGEHAVTRPGPQAAPARRRISPKWLRVALVAAIAVGLAVAKVTGFFGAEPGVGDCVTAKGAASFEVVDCASPQAQATIVGIAKRKLTSDEFAATPNPCPDFPDADVRLWTGDEDEQGTVYCARSLHAAPAAG